MRFRQQLVVGHTALLFFTMVTGVVAAIALETATARFERVARDLSADMLVIQRLRFDAEQVVSTSRSFLLTGDPATLEHFQNGVTRVNTTLIELDWRRQDLSDDVDQIEAAARKYIDAAQSAAYARAKAGDPREVVPFFERTLEPARDHFDDALTSFVLREQAAFEQASDRAHAHATWSREVVLATTALSILISIALAFISIRRLSTQYAREREATRTALRATETRDELLAVVSHDLRNPLTTITLGANLLDESTDDAHVRRHLARIRSAATSMQHLIDQLLDAAKLEHGQLSLQLERVQAGALFETVTSLFEARAMTARVALTVNASHDCSVVADRERVVRVLSNLVGNALKVTSGGGSIAVRAHREGEHVRFEVEDTGPGIPAEQQAHLFERYWQGKSRNSGVGLGLYIAKRIVTAHGGDIGVSSAVGAGSTFWFTLPAA